MQFLGNLCVCSDRPIPSTQSEPSVVTVQYSLQKEYVCKTFANIIVHTFYFRYNPCKAGATTWRGMLILCYIVRGRLVN